MIFLHVLEPFQVFGTLDVEEAGAAPDHENLANLLLVGKAAQHLLSPLVAVREVHGSGSRMFLGECGQG